MWFGKMLVLTLRSPATVNHTNGTSCQSWTLWHEDNMHSRLQCRPSVSTLGGTHAALPDQVGQHGVILLAPCFHRTPTTSRRSPHVVFEPPG
ncbi:hypothetical protein F4780DRAFT_322027 [Xylariomycetidae sp. FL0641]|nr:hypothetical protein F4780DRAFT_322027 [Xylariomycetidae sp. FL0641]